MDRKANAALVGYAKELRKGMTKEERHLWYHFLRTYPVRFYRQKVLGRYIVDFYCAKARLAVELDGSQHYQTDGLRNDGERTAYLEQYKIQVLRFSNADVSQRFEGVCEQIDRTVYERLLTR